MPRPVIRFFFDTDSRMALTRSAALLALACAAALATAPAALAQKPAKKKEKAAPAPDVLYAGRPDALRFADDLAARRGLDREWVRQAIGQARFLPQVPRLMVPAPKGTPKNWAAYRARFVEPVRIRAGVRFWNEHAATLARAEREYGVPAEIIVGILGVETLYGQHMGGFRVMDALATLAFDFPAAHPRAAERQAFFQGELEQLLSLADRTGTDPFALRGSYAGAMGLGQFMPSSWVRWAVDFDGDGRIDLFQSPADAIGSVAHYFQAHGWVPGLPTHYAVAFDEARLRLPELLAPDILPTFDAAGMEARGARPLDAGGTATAPAPAAAGPLALIELQNGGAPATYVTGTRNFYVVTRYNWSSYYAMAVIDLGREVAAAR